MSRLQKSIAMHLKPPMNDLSEKMLLDLALEAEDQTAGGMAFKFLLALEREVDIFLALSGGKTAQ